MDFSVTIYMCACVIMHYLYKTSNYTIHICERVTETRHATHDAFGQASSTLRLSAATAVGGDPPIKLAQLKHSSHRLNLFGVSRNVRLYLHPIN